MALPRRSSTVICYNPFAPGLTRVPSLRNMRSLRALWLVSNKITLIAPGDFEGATQLVCARAWVCVCVCTPP